MSWNNYDDLKGAIRDWLSRSDLDNRLGDFIALAESRIQSEITLNDTEKVFQITAPATPTNTYQLPTDYRTARSVSGYDAMGQYLLEYLPPAQFITAARGDSGKPSRYTFLGDAIQISPTPAEGEVFNLYYLARFVPLSDSDPTNWLLTNFPNVYFYGSVAEACAFMKDDAREIKWRAAFDSQFPLVREYLADQRYGIPLQIRSD